MGNGIAKLNHCFCGGGGGGWKARRRHVAAAVTSEPFDEGLGHSFCYLRPDVSSSTDDFTTISSSSSAATTTTTFSSISGAAVSANASTNLSPSLLLLPLELPSAAAFESSTSFSSAPLHPVPLSGPLAADRGFLSGPLAADPAFLSGPLYSSSYSKPPPPLSRSLSQNAAAALRRKSRRLLRGLSAALSLKPPKDPIFSNGSKEFANFDSSDPNLHWAQGKAGEDRVHVVISEDRGWVFVGIYDGFNGPDATDYLLSNLYSSVQQELKGLLWDEPGLPIEAGEFAKERLDLESCSHSQVLKALSQALKKTEEAYLDTADQMSSENPELALMGSCVLVMVMKGDDVYLMNVGDSRAVLAHRGRNDLERIREEYPNENELVNLAALQLTLDHSTCVEEEVIRIRDEHPDDGAAIANDRVKGSLKVTRAFGAGFLKQPKWNNALLEMFRIDYIGTSPYITCNPSLYHYRLGPNDRFLILSSDGLYQYFTNEEAVAEVELFIATTPEGDPAQHLVEEVLFRAAKKAGMDFHELLEIPQGDRRRYHDDISIIVISLEGRIWRSCV